MGKKPCECRVTKIDEIIIVEEVVAALKLQMEMYTVALILYT